MTVENKKKKLVAMIFVFLSVFIIAGSWLFTDIELRFYDDQIGTLLPPALLAGRDWSWVMKNIDYYGIGYYWIFFPVFLLTNNYKIIYFVISLVNILGLSVLSLFIFSFVYKYIEKDRILLTAGFSIIATLLFTYNTTLYNEYPAFFLTWIIIFIIIKLYESNNKFKSIVLSILLGLISAYSTLVHERMLALVLAIVICFTLLVFSKELKISNYILFLASLAVFYFISREIKGDIIARLWDENEINNTSVINGVSPFSRGAILGMCLCLCGNIYKFILGTYGVGLFSFIVFFDEIKKLGTKILRRKKSEQDNIKTSSVKVVFLICCFAVGITVFGLAYNQGYFINYSVENNIISQSFKSFFYQRYYILFLGPILLSTLVLFKDMKIKRKGYYAIILFLIILIKIINVDILPLIEKTDYYVGDVNFSSVMFRIPLFSGENQVFNIILSIAILLLFVSCINTKKYKLWVILSLIILLLNSNVAHIRIPAKFSNPYENSYNFVKSMEEETEISRIYCNYNYKTFQFVLYDYTVEAIDNILDISDKDIFFSKEDFGEIKNMKLYQLGEEEYVYICNELDDSIDFTGKSIY